MDDCVSMRLDRLRQASGGRNNDSSGVVSQDEESDARRLKNYGLVQQI
jgi:hypothetical protein